MNLIFFQNCVSPHQMPYIKELAKMSGVDDVVVVSPVVGLDERKKMGWNGDGNDVEGVRVVVSKDEKVIEDILRKYELGSTWCLFSGINAFAEVSACFRMSLQYNVRRAIVSEPPYVYEHPLWMHIVRFAVKDWRYVKYIDKFFVMGDDYIWYYKMWSKRWDVVPFMYCTEWKERVEEVDADDKLNVLYVGALSKRKNVGELLNAVRRLNPEEQAKVHVGIVGDGDECEELKGIVRAEDYGAETKFYGVQPMSSVPRIMQRYDVLVLPSLHDGWGAVVNEALTLGLYVICSDKCGAKCLLKDSMLGSKYKCGNVSELAELLRTSILKTKEIRDDVQKRMSWASDNISPKAVARLMWNQLNG